MSNSIRILMVEDSPADAELCEREIRKALPQSRFLRVENSRDFLSALQSYQPHLVLADYTLPRFDGLTAFRLLREQQPQIPFILITDAMNDEKAAECMKAGPWDYVLKEHLRRLGPAVLGVLEQKRIRDEKGETDKTLAAERIRFKQILDAFPYGIYIAGQDHSIEFINATLVNALGTVQGRKCHEYFHNLDAPCPWCRAHEVFRGNTLKREWHSEGNGCTYELHDIPLPNKDGSMSKLQVFLDISERKRHLQQLEESAHLFRNVFEGASTGRALTLPDGRLNIVNQALCNMLGYDADTLSQKTYIDITHPHDLDVSMEAMRNLLSGKIDSFRAEKRYLRGDNSILWVDMSTILLRDSQGKPLHFITDILDITDRKEAEEAKRLSEERFQLLVESAPDAIFIQTKGFFAYANPAAIKLFGAASLKDLLGTPVMDRFHPHYHETVRERIRLLTEEKSEVPPLEQVYVRMDGSCVDVEVSAVPFRFKENDGALVYARDISTQKQAEKQRQEIMEKYLQAQKMEAVGQLAGGVAHDFNNQLSVIMGYAEMAALKLPAENPVLDDLNEVKAAADRSANLTRQLLAFARRQPINPQVLDLNDTVAQMLKMLRRLLGENIEMIWKPGPSLWPVQIDPSQLDQVLANLTVNARDAIDKVGQVIIETKNITVDDATQQLYDRVEPGQFVLLRVSDSGKGMDQETMEHIFEPFYTTKELGRGTGLGLSTVYGIVKQNNGFISVQSEMGRGTTFTVCLPRTDTATAKPTRESHDSLQPGSETVLLVEDETHLLHLTQSILERLGYTVLMAETPEKAVAIARSHQGAIHLLMTDVVMPQMNGRELKDRIARLQPAIKVLYVSGYTADIIANQGVLQEGVHFLQKPFSAQILATKVREVLERS